MQVSPRLVMFQNINDRIAPNNSYQNTANLDPKSIIPNG